MNFQRDLQALLASADEANRREAELVKEMLSILGGWAAAKSNNTEQLRQRIARLGGQPSQPLPSWPPQQQPTTEWPSILRQQQGAGMN